jgi:FkbM family methyltransferase
MIHRIRDGLAWRLRPWRRYAFLARSFRNGMTLVSQFRRGAPCERVVLWDGTELAHPPSRGGMLETILEIWHDQVYTGSFYRPAPGDVVIDAGANVGLFSVWFARRFPHCRVIAYEPFAENYQMLERNIRAAGVTNVEPHQAGLGGCSGFGHMAAVGPRSLDHRLAVDSTNGDGTVPVQTFADVLRLAATPRIALFKVDIEGSEYDLFERAESEDLNLVDRFAIEFHEHVRPGVLDLIKAKLTPTHDVSVVAARPEYGMLYAKQTAGLRRERTPGHD